MRSKEPVPRSNEGAPRSIGAAGLSEGPRRDPRSEPRAAGVSMRSGCSSVPGRVLADARGTSTFGGVESARPAPVIARATVCSRGMSDARGSACSRSSSTPCGVATIPSFVASRSAPVPPGELPRFAPVAPSSSSPSSGSASSARTSSGTGTLVPSSLDPGGRDGSARASMRSSAARSRSTRSCPMATRVDPVSNVAGSSASMSSPSASSTSSEGASLSPGGRAVSGRSFRVPIGGDRAGSALSGVRLNLGVPFSRFSAARQTRWTRRANPRERTSGRVAPPARRPPAW